MRRSPPGVLIKRFRVQNLFGVKAGDLHLEPLVVVDNFSGGWDGHLLDAVKTFSRCINSDPWQVMFESYGGIRHGKEAHEVSVVSVEMEGSPTVKERQKLQPGERLFYELRFTAPSDDYKQVKRWETVMMRKNDDTVIGYEAWGEWVSVECPDSWLQSSRDAGETAKRVFKISSSTGTALTGVSWPFGFDSYRCYDVALSIGGILKEATQIDVFRPDLILARQPWDLDNEPPAPLSENLRNFAEALWGVQQQQDRDVWLRLVTDMRLCLPWVANAQVVKTGRNVEFLITPHGVDAPRRLAEVSEHELRILVMLLMTYLTDGRLTVTEGVDWRLCTPEQEKLLQDRLLEAASRSQIVVVGPSSPSLRLVKPWC